MLDLKKESAMGNTPSHCCFFSRDGEAEKNGKHSNLSYAGDYYNKTRPNSTSPGAQYMVRNEDVNGMQDAGAQKNNLNVNSLQHMSEREPEGYYLFYYFANHV